MVNRCAWVVIPFFVAGCLSNEGGSAVVNDAGSSIPEAGGNDATIFDAGNSDAPPIVDAGVDAPVEAGPKPVTLTTLKRGAPEPGVTIVFGDATGAILATATTNASGSVSQVVPAGSQVTAMFGTAASPRFVTIQGIEPGDVLPLNDDSSEAYLFEQVSIDAIPANPPAQTGSYTVSPGAQCASSFIQVPAALTIQQSCQNAGKFPLLIEAVDTNASPLGFTFVKGIALAPDGGLPDSGVLSVNANGTWSTEATIQTINVTHAPTTDAGSALGRLSLSEVSGGVPIGASQDFDGNELDGGPLSDGFRVHTGFADFIQEEATIRFNSLNGASYGAIAKRRAAPSAAGSDAIDLAQLLPLVTSVAIDATIPARPSVTWTSASSLTATDGVVLQMRWQVVGSDTGGSWVIVAPPTAASVKAPAVPSAFAAWLPADAPSVSSLPVLLFVDATFFTGYAQMRAVAASLSPSPALIGDYGTGIVPPLPIDGTLRLTGITPYAD